MELAPAPGIRRGDHACCVFETDDQQTQLVARFARDALARGDRLLYVADRSDDRRVLGFIETAGRDARSEVEAGAVQLMKSSELDLAGGFDGQAQLAAWDALAAQAKADGFGGLAVAAEMTWAQSWDVDPDALIEYEESEAGAFRRGELSALCQYDARWIDERLLPRATHAHRYAIEVDDSVLTTTYKRLALRSTAGASIASISGDIDLANAAFLEEQLAELLRTDDATIDCSGLQFVDVVGCRALRRACAGELGAGKLQLANKSPALTRIINLCDWADRAAS